MNSQFYAGQGALLTTRFGQALRVAPGAGELRVHHGAIWLTRRGDPADVLLEAGQRLRLRAGDEAVFEQWQRDVPALVDWQADQALRTRRLRGALLSALAFGAAAAAGGLRRAEAGFAALARTAAASASRAQGCISAGDSMASAGTVK